MIYRSIVNGFGGGRLKRTPTNGWSPGRALAGGETRSYGGHNLPVPQADGDALLDQERLDVFRGEVASADDLAESESNPVERLVSGSFFGAAQLVQLALNCSFRPRTCVTYQRGRSGRLGQTLAMRRSDGFKHPFRQRRQRRAMPLDPIPPAARMAARRRDDIAAVPSDVDAGPEPPSGVVSHEPAGMGEIQVLPAGPGSDGPCGRKRPNPRHEPFDGRRPAVSRIDVEHHQPARFACSHRNVGARPLLPPCRDLARVDGRCVKAAGDPWMLAAGTTFRITTAAPTR
jgi:hypothetical protein